MPAECRPSKGRKLSRGHLLAAVLAAAMASSAHAADPPLKCPLIGAYDPTNPFAAIIRGERRQAIVYADKQVMAFVPIGWDHPGHTLVIPRRAVRNLNDLRDSELVAIFRVVRWVAAAQQKAFGSTGFSIEQNNARHQSVCHAHFHVIPNTPEQAVQRATPEQMEAIAVKLRGALQPD